MSAVTPQRLIDGMRDVRYGEVLAVFQRDHGLEAEVFGTQMLNDCPQALWEGLDAGAIAAELGALWVKLNGPRYWTLDGFGVKGAPVEPVLRDFGGITMRRIALIELGPEPKLGPYNPARVDRQAVFFFDAGRTVHELVDPAGLAYVMQALCVGVDPGMSVEALDTLGDRLATPPGWTYRSRVLGQELVIDTTASVATVVQDEFENSYTLPH